MAFSRYAGTVVIYNDAEIYEEFLKERGLTNLQQFASSTMYHPTARERATLNRMHHTWKVGDRYYKLAQEYYGDSRYWWVIAQYNQKPTESDVLLGDAIIIPLPLEDVLAYYKL
jgi:nucleoid-associated protein YgaU